MKYEINAYDHSLSVDFDSDAEQTQITLGDRTYNFQAVQVQPGVYSILLNNRSFVVGVCQKEANRVNVNGTPIKLDLLDAVHLHLRKLGWDAMAETKVGLISAQIPGLVTKIFHAPGDQVEEGDPLFLIEAMKMENEIKAPISGVVKRIEIVEGQTVEKGTNIVEIV